MSKSLRIIFAGTPNFAALHLQALLDFGYNVVGVLTQPDRPASRDRKLIASPVKILAEEKKIPVFQPISLHLEENQKLVANLKADVVVVVAYGLIFPKSILDIPCFGCINVHGSLLPRWRGAAPVQRSILAGDIKTGITIIQIDSGIDTGNILYNISCPISDKDTSAKLCNKLVKLGKKGLIETLKKIEKNKIFPKIQDESLVTYANKLSKNEARINWLLPAIQLERCIRAFNPWPMSWIKINEQMIKIWQASVIQSSTYIQPGTILTCNKKGIQISTIDGILNLEYLQPAGKKPMSAQELLNSKQNWFIPGIKID